MARHLGTLPMYSVFTFWWNFDFVIKAKRRFLCMTLIRMKARYYFWKKNCPVCIGASKRFWYWSCVGGFGRGNSPPARKENICTIQLKMLSLSFLSKFRLKITLSRCMYVHKLLCMQVFTFYANYPGTIYIIKLQIGKCLFFTI